MELYVHNYLNYLIPRHINSVLVLPVYTVAMVLSGTRCIYSSHVITWYSLYLQ
jgi:hypothetical protein